MNSFAEIKGLVVDDIAKSVFSDRPDLHVRAKGEFLGRRSFRGDAFEANNGPFWQRMEDDGSILCACRVERMHLNGARNLHGGRLLDGVCRLLPVRLRRPPLHGPAVTVSSACEFLDAAHEAELVERTGEVIREGHSLIFLRGMLNSAKRPLFSFLSPIKRMKLKMPPAGA
jgi:acyl-coenzyme A thioesterase PaaI-like protein